MVLACTPQDKTGSAHVLAFPTSTFNGDRTKARAGDLHISAKDLVGAPTFGDDSFLRARRLISLDVDRVLFGRGLIGSVSDDLMKRAVHELTAMISCQMATYRS